MKTNRNFLKKGPRKALLYQYVIASLIMLLVSACAATSTLPSGSSLKLLGVPDIPGPANETVALPTDQDYILVLTTKTSGLAGATGSITFHMTQGPVRISPSDSQVEIKPFGKMVKSKQLLSWYYLLSADPSMVGKKLQVEVQTSYSYLHTFPLGSRKGGPFVNKEFFTVEVVSFQSVANTMENWNKDVLFIQNLSEETEIVRKLGTVTIDPSVSWTSPQHENLDKLKSKALALGANTITNLKFIIPLSPVQHSHGYSAEALIIER